MNNQFPHEADLIYLNHAAVGPWPRCTYQAVQKFAEENMHCGAKHYPKWLATEQQLRKRLCTLINAESTDSIALLKNTSEALSVIAYGLDWQAGDNIVLSDSEFPSNRIVWESLQQQGVEIRLVHFNGFEQAEADLIAATDQHTRLLTSSSVHYASGLRMQLQKLGEHCAKHNILFCVDAIQSLGAFEFNVQDIQADFVVADGHKWMLGPEGLALFYCKSTRIEQLKLLQYGWHMIENAGDYNQTEWQPAGSARRFECGSPNMLGIHGLEASLNHLQTIGINHIEKSITENTAYIIEKLQQLDGALLLSPAANQHRAGIVTFKIEGKDSALLHQSLMQNNVICAHRGGGIRFSPHYYNTLKQLNHAFEVLKSTLA